MLLDKNGKLTMRKLKASCLSLELRVEPAVVTYDECQGNLLDHPTNWPFQHFIQMGKSL